MLKLCSKCDELKETSAFTRCSRALDGFNWNCRPCQQTLNNESYHKHREKRLASNKAAYSPEANAARRVRIMKEQRATMLVWNIKKRAEKKVLSFDLDQHVEALQVRIDAGRCEMSGVDFDMQASREWATPSIDRIDSFGGYIYSNVRVICYGLNVAMNRWGEDVLAERVAEWLEYRKSLPC